MKGSAVITEPSALPKLAPPSLNPSLQYLSRLCVFRGKSRFLASLRFCELLQSGTPWFWRLKVPQVGLWNLSKESTGVSYNLASGNSLALHHARNVECATSNFLATSGQHLSLSGRPAHPSKRAGQIPISSSPNQFPLTATGCGATTALFSVNRIGWRCQ